MPYKKTKDGSLVNEVTLGDGYPLSNDLQPLKVGGEASPIEMSTSLPDDSDNGKVKVRGDLEVTGGLNFKNDVEVDLSFDDLSLSGDLDVAGSVGIGTSSPSVKLDVEESSVSALIDIHQSASSTGTDSGIRFQKNSNLKGTVGYNAGTDTVNLNYGAFDNTHLNIDSSGNVGIGTTSPDSNLHIKSSSATQPVLQLETALDGGGADTFIRFGDSTENYSYALGIDDSSNTFRLAYNGSSYNGAVLGTTDLITVSTAGNVGIGTSSPTTTLDVNGTANFSDDVTLPDSKKIYLGNGNDLEIHHNGSNSVIKDNGTGDLSLQSNGAKVSMYDAANGAFMAKFNTGAGVELFYNGTEVFETTSTGVNIEGTVSYKHTAFTTAGPTDNVDVSDTTVLEVDTSSNNVTIGGFTGGVQGQILYIVKTDTANFIQLEHNEGGGSQDIFLTSGSDDRVVGYGGFTLYCNGTSWFSLSNPTGAADAG